MDSSNALREVADELPPPVRPAAVLRGTARGLEFHVWAGASRDAISAALQKRLDEAPGFFKGSDVRVRVEDGKLPAGTLTALDELAEMFELKIVEVAAAAAAPEAVPQPTFAAGSARAPLSLAKSDPAAPELATEAVLEADSFDDEPTNISKNIVVSADAETIADLKTELVDKGALITAAATELASAKTELLTLKLELANAKSALAAQAALAKSEQPAELSAIAASPGTRIMLGPVRSGVILEHIGNIFIFGDVNPGAEVRATGNIIVLGRLRGTAHAGINNENAFVLALWLQPQQLRIGRQVARAADSDLPSAEAEIAYGTSDRIVVERYAGRLPRNLSI